MSAVGVEFDPNSRESLRLEAERLSYDATVRQLGRCAVRGCGAVVAADVVLHVRYTVVNGMGMVGFDLKRAATVERPSVSPACGHGSTRWETVQARKTDTRCGARCRNAKRADCECECNGEHHGEGWLA